MADNTRSHRVLRLDPALAEELLVCRDGTRRQHRRLGFRRLLRRLWRGNGIFGGTRGTLGGGRRSLGLDDGLFRGRFLGGRLGHFLGHDMSFQTMRAQF